LLNGRQFTGAFVDAFSVDDAKVWYYYAIFLRSLRMIEFYLKKAAF
jgi:hypothetical protein